MREDIDSQADGCKVYEWIGGKHACVELTSASPIVRLRTDAFNMG
jgi:hypothetical protein